MASGAASRAPSGASLAEHAQERRQALDGEWYTMEEFMQYYEEPYYWDQAVREARRSAAEPAAALAAPGASQPGPVPPVDLQLGLVERPWQDAEFLQATLPTRKSSFSGSGQVFRVATSPREAMGLAYTLEQHLPLPASAFVNFDLGSRFSASPPLVVVAEKVLRVRDHNRPPHCRIDSFC